MGLSVCVQESFEAILVNVFNHGGSAKSLAAMRGFFCGFWFIRNALPLGDRTQTDTPSVRQVAALCPGGALRSPIKK